MRIESTFYRSVLIFGVLMLVNHSGALAQSSERPLSLGVQQTIAFDSNLFRLSDSTSVPPSSGLKSRSDQISNTAMTLGYANSFGSQNVSVAANIGAIRYADFSRGNRNVYGISAKVNGDLNRAVFAGLDLGQNRNASAFADQQGLSPNLISTSSLGLTLGYRLNPTWSIVSKVDATIIENSAQDLAASNRRLQGKEVGLRYSPESGLDGSFVLRRTNVKSQNSQLTDFFGNALPSSVNNGFEQNTVLFRLNYQPAGLSRFNGELGYAQIDYTSLTQRDSGGLRFKISYDYSYSDALSFRTTAGRDTTSTGTAFSSNVQNDTLGLSMSLAATPRVRLLANVDYIRRNFAADGAVALGVAPTRVDTINALGMSLNYELLRNLNISAGYSRTNRTSTFSQFEYSGNIFTIGANLVLR
jgi:Putative beta-barrel porin 2